ncbi:MAG: hypothetical protein M9921_14180 [Fimbriimonadaceae bacterium]|nr:hypothetical protein [Fimbriimonadaceae bacterium]
MADDAPHRSDDDEPDLDAIEKAAQEAADRLLGADHGSGAPSAAADPDDEFDARLKEIEDKSRQLRSGAMPEPPEWEYKRKPRKGDPTRSDRESYRGVAFGIGLAYLFVGPLIAGWLIGYFVDQGSGGNQWQTWGTVIGLFAGFLAVVVMITKGPNRP